MNPLFRIDFSISDSLKIVRKSVLIYETIIDLSGVEVKAFLIALSHLPGAAELAAKLPKSGDKL